MLDRYKYESLDVLHEKPTQDERKRWRKSAVAVGANRVVHKELAKTEPHERTEEERAAISRKLNKAIEEKNSHYAMFMIGRAESGEASSGFYMIEQNLFALVAVVKLLQEQPDVLDKYIPEVYGQYPPGTRENLESLRYLGRCLEDLLNGVDTDESLRIKGGKGRPKLTPEAMAREAQSNYLRRRVAVMVEAFKAHENMPIEDIYLEVSELFEMPDKENTVKDWYRKYKPQDHEIYFWMAVDDLKDKEYKADFVKKTLEFTAKTMKSTFARLPE